ncbi:MAG: hypothetical protein AAF517_19255 [Planctomycetota bacterium]
MLHCRALQHRDCGCRSRVGALGSLRFRSVTDYPFPYDYRIVDKRSSSVLMEGTESNQEMALALSLESLLSLVEPGKNELELEVWDRENRAIRGTAALSLSVYSPQDWQVEPDSGEVKESATTVTVTGGRGPRVARVLVDGELADSTPGTTVWTAKVRVPRFGEKRVDVAIESSPECRRSRTLSFWSAPVDRRRYRFSFGADVGELTLEYRRTSKSSAFWVSERTAGRELARRYRRSRAERNSKKGTSWNEAQAIVRWLNDSIQSVEFADSRARFSLPDEAQWRALLPRLPSAKQPAFEWLKGSAKNGAVRLGSFSRDQAARVLFADADESQDSFSFRVILPAGAGERWPSPRHAIGLDEGSP